MCKNGERLAKPAHSFSRGLWVSPQRDLIGQGWWKPYRIHMSPDPRPTSSLVRGPSFCLG